jgi:single-strand DNA-binding protein
MSGFVINRVHLSGNLTADPEHRTIPSSGTTLCKLRIANNERYKDSGSGEWMDRPNYFNVTMWKGMADWVANNLHKGDEVVIEGRLRWHEWEDNGQKRSAVDITADSIVPTRTRNGGGSRSSSGGYQESDADVPYDSSDLPEAGAQAAASTVGEPGVGEDDIPF